jgi:type IV pilus assembly protein PilX
MALLLILSLSAAAVLRNAVSSERYARNLRQQQMAQQQAELALRYCEAELRKPDGSESGLPPGVVLREPALAEARLTRVAWDALPAWSQPAHWAGMGGAGTVGTARVVLPPDQAAWPAAGLSPGRPPECLVELQELADGALVHVVTARGYSPAYPTGPDLSPGTVPAGGAVVWLQSTLLLGEPAVTGERPILDRLWRRILHPPLP